MHMRAHLVYLQDLYTMRMLLLVPLNFLLSPPTLVETAMLLPVPLVSLQFHLALARIPILRQCQLTPQEILVRKTHSHHVCPKHPPPAPLWQHLPPAPLFAHAPPPPPPPSLLHSPFGSWHLPLHQNRAKCPTSHSPWSYQIIPTLFHQRETLFITIRPKVQSTSHYSTDLTCPLILIDQTRRTLHIVLVALRIALDHPLVTHARMVKVWTVRNDSHVHYLPTRTYLHYLCLLYNFLFLH